MNRILKEIKSVEPNALIVQSGKDIIVKSKDREKLKGDVEKRFKKENILYL